MNAVLLETVLIGLKHLDSAIDFIERLVSQAPTAEGLAQELAKRAQRIAALSSQIVAAQAEDQALLDKRVPK